MIQIISKINNNYQLKVLRMQNNNRSKDATFALKSCKNRSIETKQQSIVRSSPKSTKHTLTNQNKNKRKIQKSNKNIIKSKDKLDVLVSKITEKLGSFQKQSGIVTLSTTTNISKTEVIKRNQYEVEKVLQYKPNKQTHNIIEHIQKDRSKISVLEADLIKIKQQPSLKQQMYENIFQSALERPHCLKKMKIKRKNIIDRYSKEHLLMQEVKQYKKMQNQNWSSINKELTRYLSMPNQDVIDNKHKLIEAKLFRQGQENYRWLQIQNKMKMEDYRLMEGGKILKRMVSVRGKDKQPQQQFPEGSLNLVQAVHDQPLSQKMILKNYNWQKFIWADDQVSSTSDLNCNSRVNSQAEYLNKNINLDELVEETNYIQENVDIILNWILDQFVVELAEKLDFNLLMGFDKNNKNTTHARQDQTYKQFISTINQISQDCQHIQDLNQKKKNIKLPLYIIHAFNQKQKNNPSLNKDEVKEKLLKSVCSRDLDLSEIYLPDQKQEEEYNKIAFLYQLDQMIWEDLIIEETWKMWRD